MTIYELSWLKVCIVMELSRHDKIIVKKIGIIPEELATFQ